MGRCAALERRLHPLFIQNLRFLTFLGSSVALPESFPCTVVSRLLSWPHFSCAGRPSFETLDHSYPSRPIHATLPLSRSSDSHLPPSYRSSRSRLDTGTRRVILHPIRTAAVSSPPVLFRSYSTVLATVLVLGSWVSTSASKAVRIGFHNRPGVDSTAGFVSASRAIVPLTCLPWCTSGSSACSSARCHQRSVARRCEFELVRAYIRASRWGCAGP
jgi:hypothetical protein